jgi:hypothetical protein
MPDQFLSRRSLTGDIMPRGQSVEHAEAVLGQLGSASMTVIAAIDVIHGQVNAYCRQGQGQRSAEQQKVLLSRAAVVLNKFDRAAIEEVLPRTYREILAARTREEPPPVRIVEVEVPQKGLFPRLFGK